MGRKNKNKKSKTAETPEAEPLNASPVPEDEPADSVNSVQSKEAVEPEEPAAPVPEPEAPKPAPKAVELIVEHATCMLVHQGIAIPLQTTGQPLPKDCFFSGRGETLVQGSGRVPPTAQSLLDRRVVIDGGKLLSLVGTASPASLAFRVLRAASCVGALSEACRRTAAAAGVRVVSSGVRASIA